MKRTLPSSLTLFLIMLLFSIPGFTTPNAWKSPSLERHYVQVSKQLLHPELDAEDVLGISADLLYRALPATVRKALGPAVVEYDRFVAAYLTDEETRELARLAAEEKIEVLIEQPERQSRPDPGRRSARWAASGLEDRLVPGLFLARFAYPIREEWMSSLEACGAREVANLGDQVIVIRAADRAAITNCGAAKYLSWVDNYSMSDRTQPEILTANSTEGYLLEFVPGTPLDEMMAEIPPGVTVLETYDLVHDRISAVRVAADRKELLRILSAAPPLLAVSVFEREISLSDERQGQIVAGNHNGATLTLPSSPGYVSFETWLQSRGHLSATNMPAVAIFDTGYDDGTGALGSHHPDLENPERVLDAAFYVGSSLADTEGHGTMVAGIIAGSGPGGASVGGGLRDAQLFYRGSGVAPSARLVPVKIWSVDNTCARNGSPTEAILGQALSFSRTDSVGGVKALVANQSWNEGTSNYTLLSRLFDQRVVDASSDHAGEQPMTIVFSAGNGGYNNNFGTVNDNSVRAPANAKNVIAVGATESYRPSPDPSLTCTGHGPVGSGNFFSLQDATHIARLARISSRGRHFGPWPDPSGVHNTRVKPDLVAPGVRVFSTIPFNTASTYVCPAGLCTPASPAGTPYSYAAATSFAAPVVSGVAAHAYKWFKDRAIDASPSLIKAALISTADDLGIFSEYNGDHRPSNDFGWGRVSLGRLTSSRARFYRTDDPFTAVATGQERTWTRTVDDPSDGVFIVLAWSDPACPTLTTLCSLTNNLDLRVDWFGSPTFWRGNNFEENHGSGDTGFSQIFAVGGQPILQDSTNNVEAVFLPPGMFQAGQKLTVRVSGASVASGTSQTFAVYAYNLRLIQ